MSERQAAYGDMKLRDDDRLYIGAKLIRARPMDSITFRWTIKNGPPAQEGEGALEGYKVTYPDGYVSWSPKAVFEEAYREVSPGERNLF